MEHFISKTDLTKLLPNLLDRIHFRSCRRNECQMNICRYDQSVCFVPCCAVTNKKYFIIRIFLGKLLQKYVHANGIAVWHDKEKRVSCHWFDRSVGVAIFTNMMTRNIWTISFPAPAVFGLIYPSESGFILKHQANFASCIFSYFGSQNLNRGFNFFEASIASSLALLGC